VAIFVKYSFIGKSIEMLILLRICTNHLSE